ncbi:flagellar motor stator protein MotA [Marinomonas piezotolerans]|uniref:Flagellar motor stator protein MotA n=1 Tax=Marinomonas piezotolerans TaxID=2213058 RepID=A0A370U5D9_9GAMM|nr:flagellar motor stator protein MotA [Marinomonas piezotolerans]RDL43000.1 flagellar motor stator protein MotA [Marinomonas piezotolerans]
MFVLAGMLVVIVSVVTGYIASHGEMLALWQPFEVLIIVGSALGAFFIANPLSLQIQTAKLLPQIIVGSRHNTAFQVQLLGCVYSIFQRSRQEGLLAIEQDIEAPFESDLFSRFPDVLRDHALVEFFTDNYRVYTMTGLPVHEFEAMMDAELELIQEELVAPSHAVNRVAEGLPGFGIVAAVLGIVITMGAIGGPMDEIGTHVAAALVGTFLGIFFAYGFVGPVSAHLERLGEQEFQSYLCLKACLNAMAAGHPPTVCAEAGRKMLPLHMRPSFIELSELVKQYR